MKRDQAWLEAQLGRIWEEYFRDVRRRTPIVIKFGRRARNRLGSLSYHSHQNVAIVRVTALFQDPSIPVFVVKATIIHELCHYAHGFNSGLKRRHQHPHRGGVIRREFAERGLEDLYLKQKDWLKTHWPAVVRRHFPNLKLRRRLRWRIKII